MSQSDADYRTLQARFASALSDRETVEEAIPQFVGDTERVAQRLALYRGNVLAARSKALQAAYPVATKIVGEEFFSALARAYMQAHPSTSGDLNGFGAELASFIAHFDAAAELPYLPDVARLEWLVHCAHYAADRDPIDLSHVAAIPVTQQANARLTLQPASALLQSDYPLGQIWAVHQDDYVGEFDVSFDNGPYYTLVRRPHWRVQVQNIDAATYVFLQALKQGAPLTTALAAALEQPSQFDLGSALLSALENRLIVDCRVEGDKQ